MNLRIARQRANLATARLQELADPEKAREMQAYMKTEMPFFGVQAKARDEILRDVYGGVDCSDQATYEALVLALWTRAHREEKYLAVRVARRFRPFQRLESLPLYERMVREGAWWGFVDEIASHLVGGALRKDRDSMWPILDAWIDDEDLWIRRAALHAQKGLKDQTDAARLFSYCRELADQEEFFIQKAIGWALREYARTDPDGVRGFLDEHAEGLSNLAVRDARKHLK